MKKEKKNPVKDEKPTSDSSCIVRGGAWDGDSYDVCPAYRASCSPRTRDYFFGFRIVRNQK